MYYSTRNHIVRDAMAIRRRRMMRDAYLRGYRDAISIKDLFDKFLTAIKSGLLKVKDFAQEKVLVKLKDLALRAKDMIASGASSAAAKIWEKIGQIIQKYPKAIGAAAGAAGSAALVGLYKAVKFAFSKIAQRKNNIDPYGFEKIGPWK